MSVTWLLYLKNNALCYSLNYIFYKINANKCIKLRKIFNQNIIKIKIKKGIPLRTIRVRRELQ